MARNLALDIYPSWATREALKLQKNRVCVFISHQKGDREIAKKIADYLIQVGISVYFDEYDKDARIANQTQNPKDVVKAILKGINISSHMICIISPNTVNSKWVPFEVGYGYDNVVTGVILQKGILTRDLPEYLKALDYIVPDIYDLNLLIEELLKKENPIYQNKARIKAYNEISHPLIDFMDSIRQIVF